MDKEGVLYICKIENKAKAGAMPHDVLTKVAEAYYQKRTMGFSRMYAAMGANQQIDLLVRCFNTQAPTNGHEFCVVFPQDSAQYRVTLIQEIVGSDAVDLSLVRLEDYFDVYTV